MADHSKEDVMRVVEYANAEGIKPVTAEMTHMLIAYAERLKEDDGALCSDGECPHRFIAHTHPPAQAAQVDDSAVASFVERAASVICGKPFPTGHALTKAREISDLALSMLTTAEPVAQGDAPQYGTPAMCDLLIRRCGQLREEVIAAKKSAQPRAVPDGEAATGYCPALEADLTQECERAMRQRDMYLKTGVSTVGGAHTTFISVISCAGIACR